ncbi:permease [Anaerotignum sp.]|uniref:permease n=1 Tax=Anaerotignum sp. TaxID=2039241 RepID=UPI00289CF004|nr:permease [Anaerotignum sp.]
MDIQTFLFYFAAIFALIFSFVKDKKKSKLALKKAWKSFENILPQVLSLLVIVGILLAIVNTDVISQLIGENSGWLGVVLAGSVGAITLIPPYVAFPTAALLIDAGAGYMQIGAFISSLMMVGLVTIPVETKFFGKKLTFLRNLYAFIFSFFVAIIIRLVVGS